MKRTDQLACLKAPWRGREAYHLSNSLVHLTHLTGGGHIAEFRFTEASGFSTLSPLWIPPWKTIEPYRYRPKLHAARYGEPAIGKTLAGIVGHNICLDYFGTPSEEEAAQGLSIHGEAPCSKWRKTRARVTNHQAALKLSVRLPVAGLRFSREVKLRRGESVIYFEETVRNERKADHFFHWTQHVTLSPPFLTPRGSRVAISATKGITFPYGYEGKALLASSKEFRWPFAPAVSRGKVDLTRPFTHRGLGFVASALLDPRRETEFIAAVNVTHRLLVGYCFRRTDFPWVTVWEENCARTEVPEKGRCQARGLEFTSNPIPVTRRESFARGPLFNVPTFSTVAACGSKTVRYVAFLTQLPAGFGDVRDLHLAKNEILVRGSGRKQTVHVAASGLAATGLV